MPTKKALGCSLAGLMAAVLMFLALPARVAAQDGDDPPARVARLSYLSGAVSFQPAGESDWAAATLNRPMTTGDKLWSDEDSRAELHIGSAAIRLDSDTGFSFLNLDDQTVQIQLSAGTLNIRVRHLGRDEVFEVDTPNQAFSILRPGEYRFEANEDGDRTWIAVREGEGEVTGGDRAYTIESRERAVVTGTDTLDADISRMDRRDRDDFDDWCEERDRREERSRSVRYVSPEMVGYEDLDDNGVWRHDPEYGEVWMPTAVPDGWAPYRYGHWAWISPWGWTWVDDASWGYAPFHYGRWAYARGAWFWVPGPINVAPVYAPALVAFVGGPNFSLGLSVGGGSAVAWFPLGPREVYVPAYRTSPDYVTRVNITNTNVNRTAITNVYNTTVINNTTVVRNVTYVNRMAPGAVTAVSTTAFTGAQPVARSAIRVDQRQITGANVITRASVAPTQTSVFGHYDNKPGRPIPPGFMNRPVVARTPPPPPPVPFARQESALKEHPGQPLRRTEVENLRPAETVHPPVRPASSNQPENRNPSRGFGQTAERPGVPNREDDNPARRGNGFGFGRANNPAAGVPSRNDRSEPDRDRPAVSEAPNAQPSYRPTGRPADTQPGYRWGQQNRPEQPVSAPNPLPSNNPPVESLPNYRPPRFGNRPAEDSRSSNGPALNNPPRPAPSPEPPANQPNVPPAYRSPSLGNRRNSAAPPNERPAAGNERPNTPAQEPPANRPSTMQPIYRPLAPAGSPSERPVMNNRPSNVPPASQPPNSENRAPSAPANGAPGVNHQPQSEHPPQTAPNFPRNNQRVEPQPARPVNPPAPSVAAPPSGGPRAIPEIHGHAPNAAPSRPNGNSNKKENEKRN